MAVSLSTVELSGFVSWIHLQFKAAFLALHFRKNKLRSGGVFSGFSYIDCVFGEKAV